MRPAVWNPTEVRSVVWDSYRECWVFEFVSGARMEVTPELLDAVRRESSTRSIDGYVRRLWDKGSRGY